MTPAKRVLIGQIFHEAHGFTPLRTSLDAFAIETGEALIALNAEADSVLGGLIRVGRRAGWELVPSIAARASPGGRVHDAAYQTIKRHILTVAEQGGIDAVALCLHGCMQTETLDSAEADLLAALREIVGPQVPIVAGFDLHGHANGGMLRYLDFASAYRTNPHGDAGETGERVGHVLQEILAQGTRPAGAAVAVPLLTSGNDETASGPLARLHALARARVSADPLLLDASLFNVNPFIDGEGVGQTAVVYARSAAGFENAQSLALDLAEGLWAAREEFRHSLPGLEEVLARHPGRLVLGDFGDRVLAGGPGDSLFLLDELRRHAPGRRVIAPLTDAPAVSACVRAGAGAHLTLTLGGRHTPGGAAMALNGVVRRTGDGSYRNRGAFMHGALLRVGPFAVFEGDGFTLLITSEPLMSQDPGCFIDCGIDPDTADVIVVKSGYHFKLAFGAWGACVCVATPGLTTYEPSAFGFEKARPLFPLDDFAFDARAVAVGTPYQEARTVAIARP